MITKLKKITLLLINVGLSFSCIKNYIGLCSLIILQWFLKIVSCHMMWVYSLLAIIMSLPDEKIALIQLNTPIGRHVDRFKLLWDRGMWVFTVM